MSTHAQASARPLKRFVTDYPLIAYFVLAYAGAWIILLPMLLSENGLGLLPYTVPDVLAFLSFVLFASFAGPTLAAYITTYITNGQDGVQQLRRRYALWRVSIHWYLIALFIFLIGFLLSTSISFGAHPWNATIQHWPLILGCWPW